MYLHPCNHKLNFKMQHSLMLIEMKCNNKSTDHQSQEKRGGQVR